MRSSLGDSKNKPGPGSYNMKFEKILKGNPGWTFEQSDKYEKWRVRDHPGPGSYNFKHSVGDSPNYLFYNIKKKIPGV